MNRVFNLRFLFALAVALLGAYALYASLGWSFRTALFPRLIGVPILALSLLEMVLSLVSAEQEREGHAVDFEMTTDVEPAIARRRTVAIFSWTLGFLALILLVGFPIAVPLFVFLYVKLVGKERWVLTLSLTLVSWLTMEGLFNRLLNLPFPQGWLFALRL